MTLGILAQDLWILCPGKKAKDPELSFWLAPARPLGVSLAAQRSFGSHVRPGEPVRPAQPTPETPHRPTILLAPLRVFVVSSVSFCIEALLAIFRLAPDADRAFLVTSGERSVFPCALASTPDPR
jgi:hypothetical protein